MSDIVCLVVIVLTLIYWIFRAFMPSRKTMNHSALLSMQAYIVVLKKIKSVKSIEQLNYIETLITEFEKKFHGRIYTEVLAMMVNDLNWEIINIKSEL